MTPCKLQWLRPVFFNWWYADGLLVH